MQVRKIDLERKADIERFIHFPFELYADCPRWVPPLVSSEKQALNRRKHPFYRHSTADFFVAQSDGQVVGRIAVMHHRRYNQYRRARAAFFGYFEVIQEQRVAQALFDAAFDWARQRGLDEMIGPRGLLGTDGGGVLVEGFEHPPALGVPYNHPYYDALITGAGLVKDTDYLSGVVRRGHQLPERIYRIAEKVQERRGFHVRAFRNKREMRRWVPRVVQAHRQAFSENHTYCPPTDAEIALIVETVLSVADPRLIKLVMKGEELAGFVFVYPDLSLALQKAQGRLWPWGWYHLLRERRRTRRLNANGLGFLPAYQGLGGNAVLYVEVAKTLESSRFEQLDLIQTEEGNVASLADIEVIGARWYKRHRSYRRPLENGHG
ncbi:MAG: hypothetical protein ACOYZ7_06250 [Chloroflexota bacterium]